MVEVRGGGEWEGLVEQGEMERGGVVQQKTCTRAQTLAWLQSQMFLKSVARREAWHCFLSLLYWG